MTRSTRANMTSLHRRIRDMGLTQVEFGAVLGYKSQSSVSTALRRKPAPLEIVFQAVAALEALPQRRRRAFVDEFLDSAAPQDMRIG